MTGHAARVALAAAILLSGIGAVAAVPHSGSPAGVDAAPFAQSEVDPDSVVLDVTLAENGTATWAISYRVELTTDNETAAFESLQADIQANTSTYLSSFRDRMERTVRTAENATGRSMSIRGLSVSTNIEEVQQYGTVTYQFQWTNFGVVDGDTIRMGDALAGFFLEENSRLTVSWPEGYDVDSIAPEPDDRRSLAATWEGPIEFGPNGPQVVVSPTPAFPTTIAIGGAILGIVLALGLYFAFHRDAIPWSGESETTTEATDEAGAEPVPDEELLSNEERVLRLLDERGGRIKQQEVATEFDWTDAKTSQVVKTLRENDEIDVFRLGRENVLVDPEESDL